ASRTSTMKSLNWLRNTMKGEIFFPSLSRLGPTAFSLLSASPLSRPTAGSTSKWAATRSASHSTQRLFSDTSTPPLSNLSSLLLFRQAVKDESRRQDRENARQNKKGTRHVAHAPPFPCQYPSAGSSLISLFSDSRIIILTKSEGADRWEGKSQ